LILDDNLFKRLAKFSYTYPVDDSPPNKTNRNSS